MICEGCDREVFRSRFDGESSKWFCLDCHPGMGDSTAAPGFPFTTSNFNGKPVEVSSMRHLRRLEKQHGMNSVAYNMNESNHSAPPRGRE